MEQDVDRESGDPSPEIGPDSENTTRNGSAIPQAQSPHTSGEDYSRGADSIPSSATEEPETTGSGPVSKDQFDSAITGMLDKISSLATQIEQVNTRITAISNLSTAIGELSNAVMSVDHKCDSLLSSLLEVRDRSGNTELKLDVIGSELSQLRATTSTLEESVNQQKQETLTSFETLRKAVSAVSTDVANSLQEFSRTLDEQVASLQRLTETYTACAELISKLDSKIVNGVNEWLAVSTTAVSDTFVLSSMISDIGPVLNDLRSFKNVVDTLVLSSLNIEKVFKEWNVYGGSVSAALNSISVDIRDMKDTKLLLEKISTVTSLVESLSNTVVNAVSIKKKIVV